MPSRLRSPRLRTSLALRITVLTAGAVGTTVLLGTVIAYLTVGRSAVNQMDLSLKESAEEIIATYTREEIIGQRTTPVLTGASRLYLSILEPRDSIEKVKGEAPAPIEKAIGEPELAVAAEPSTWSARTVTVEDDRYRMVAVHAHDNSALVFTQSLEVNDRMLTRLRYVMLIFSAIGVLLSSIIGWVVASSGLRPLRRLAGTIERIAETEELTAIRVTGNDEVARLAVTFNQLLASVEGYRTRQRQLVADAGHELRTPLTSLRTNLDLLVQADSVLPEEARREILTDVRGQIGELSTLVGDLVELARDEPAEPQVVSVNIADMVDAAAARVRRRALGLTFKIACDPWWVQGDATSLERAITNLLDNAVKWSPPNGAISVNLRQGRLSVQDEGTGIAEEDMPHIFERFYRSTESRGMPGSGLGLSIVKSIIDSHGGKISVGTSEGGGAIFRVSLPGGPRRPPSTS